MIFSSIGDIGLKVYIGFALAIAFLILIVLLKLLRKMLNDQIEYELDNFASEARIPQLLRKQIGIRIIWK